MNKYTIGHFSHSILSTYQLKQTYTVHTHSHLSLSSLLHPISFSYNTQITSWIPSSIPPIADPQSIPLSINSRSVADPLLFFFTKLNKSKQLHKITRTHTHEQLVAALCWQWRWSVTVLAVFMVGAGGGAVVQRRLEVQLVAWRCSGVWWVVVNGSSSWQ